MNAKFHLKENVIYQKSHCDMCAQNPETCPQKGTMHGASEKLFQTWAWVSYLIKRGWIAATHPKIPMLLGYWSDSAIFANLIVNVGAATIPALIGGTGTSYGVYKYIAVGTGAVAASATDTALGAEIVDSGLVRGTSTNTSTTTDVTNDTLNMVLSFAVTGTKAVTESGIFNASPTGTMLARQVFSAINVISGDTLQMTWQIDVD